MGENELIIVDIEKCMGCRTCELECALSHSYGRSIYQAIWEFPRPAKRIFVESTGENAFPLQCRHCEDPPCAGVCPTGALSRDEEKQMVSLNQEKCIGCKYCIIACPFGVIFLHGDDKKIFKCDLCMETGDDLPACVGGCPTGAISFIPPEELSKTKRREFMVEFLETRGSATQNEQ